MRSWAFKLAMFLILLLPVLATAAGPWPGFNSQASGSDSPADAGPSQANLVVAQVDPPAITCVGSLTGRYAVAIDQSNTNSSHLWYCDGSNWILQSFQQMGVVTDASMLPTACIDFEISFVFPGSGVHLYRCQSNTWADGGALLLADASAPGAIPIADGDTFNAVLVSGDGTIDSSGNLALSSLVATPGTGTKTTVNAKGLVTGVTNAILNSSDYANQGTTTTLLHGNAAGNPSWAQVNLGTEVTGAIAVANGRTQTAVCILDGTATPTCSVNGIVASSICVCTYSSASLPHIVSCALSGTTITVVSATTLDNGSVNILCEGP